MRVNGEGEGGGEGEGACGVWCGRRLTLEAAAAIGRLRRAKPSAAQPDAWRPTATARRWCWRGAKRGPIARHSQHGHVSVLGAAGAVDS